MECPRVQKVVLSNILLLISLFVFSSCIFSDDGVITSDKPLEPTPYVTLRVNVDFKNMPLELERRIVELRPVLIWHMLGNNNQYFLQQLNDFSRDSSGVFHIKIQAPPSDSVFSAFSAPIGKIWFFDNRNGSGVFTESDMYHPMDKAYTVQIDSLESLYYQEFDKLLAYAYKFEESQLLNYEFYYDTASGFMWQQYEDEWRDTLFNWNEIEVDSTLFPSAEGKKLSTVRDFLSKLRKVYRNHNKYERFIYQRGFRNDVAFEESLGYGSVLKFEMRDVPSLFSRYSSKKEEYGNCFSRMSKYLIEFILKESIQVKNRKYISESNWEDYPLNSQIDGKNWLTGMSYEYYLLYMSGQSEVELLNEAISGNGLMSITNGVIHGGYNIYYADVASRDYEWITPSTLYSDSVVEVKSATSWRKYQPDIFGFNNTFVADTVDSLLAVDISGSYKVDYKEFTLELTAVNKELWLYLPSATAKYMGVPDLGYFRLKPTNFSGVYKSALFLDLSVKITTTSTGVFAGLGYRTDSREVFKRVSDLSSTNMDYISRVQDFHQTYPALNYKEEQMTAFRGIYSLSLSSEDINITPDVEYTSSGKIINVLNISSYKKNMGDNASLSYTLYPYNDSIFYNPDIGAIYEFKKYLGSEIYHKIEFSDHLGKRSLYNSEYRPRDASHISGQAPIFNIGGVINSQSGAPYPYSSIFGCLTVVKGGHGVIRELSNSGEDGWYLDDLEDYMLVELTAISGRIHFTMNICFDNALAGAYLKVEGGESLSSLKELQDEMRYPNEGVALTINPVLVTSDPYYIKITPVNSLGFMPKVAFDNYVIKQ
jgi:hypothetical protein